MIIMKAAEFNSSRLFKSFEKKIMRSNFKTNTLFSPQNIMAAKKKAKKAAPKKKVAKKTAKKAAKKR